MRAATVRRIVRDELRHEVEPNDGRSIKDLLARIDAGVAALDARAAVRHISVPSSATGWTLKRMDYPKSDPARLDAEVNAGAEPKPHGVALVASKLDELTLAVTRLSDGLLQVLDLLVAQSAHDEPRPVVDVPSHDSSLSVDAVSPTVEGTPGGGAEQSAPQTTN